MPDSGTLTVFIIAALVLLVTPGPAVLFIVARSLEKGWRAGIVSALGLSAGGIVHVVAAVVGLSALLAKSALAFSVIKYLGATYLLYLGIRALLQAANDAGTAPERRGRAANLFAQGLLVNLFNPKAALFVLAFIPQFVDPNAGDPVLQTLVLGGLFVALGVVTDLAYVLLASTSGRILAGAANRSAPLKKLSGFTYIGLGVYAALSGTASES